VTKAITSKKPIVRKEPTSQIKLREVPATFLNAKKWDRLRSSTANKLIALCYLNAPYPDPTDPHDLLCGNGRSRKKAVELYKLGRSLLEDGRRLLQSRKLVASGIGPNGKRVKIPTNSWFDLWPLFATGRANGPGIMPCGSRITFHDVKVYQTKRTKMEQACADWLSANPDAAIPKKRAFHNARVKLGEKLSHRIFNAAYKHVFERSRGRPPKA
jgi:hypothetical protein